MALMKLWECDMETFHNEDTDTDPDNPLTARIQRNVSEGFTTSPNIGVIASSPELQWFLQSSIFSQPESRQGSFSALMPTGVCGCGGLSQGCRAGAGKHSDVHETGLLEDVNSKSEEEIPALERERENLDLLSEAHEPICKLKDPNSQ